MYAITSSYVYESARALPVYRRRLPARSDAESAGPCLPTAHQWRRGESRRSYRSGSSHGPGRET